MAFKDTVEIHCPICGKDTSYQVKYEANFDPESLDFSSKKTSPHMLFRNVQCDGCTLVYSTPIFPFEDIQRLYEGSDFHEFDQMEIMADSYEKLFFKHISGVSETTRVLEVGCANGFFLKRLKRNGLTNFWGVEPNSGAYSNTDKAIKPRVINDFLCNDLFKPESFDVACSFQVFDHVLDPNNFLKKINGYLKPSGFFLQVHHNVNSLLPTLLGSKASTFDIEHIHLWSPKTMRLILEKHGFEVVVLKNISTSYQIAHALERFPMVPWLKKVLFSLVRWTRLENVTIRFPVENMVIVSKKKEVPTAA